MNPRTMVGVAALMLAGAWSTLAASQQGGIYREPFYGSRPVRVVEAEIPPPVELGQATITLNPVSSSFRLNVLARQRGNISLSLGEIVLRIAFGEDGTLRSHRLVHDGPIDGLVPQGMWQPVIFHLAADEAPPGLRAVSLSTPAAVTIERIIDPNGTDIWTNPNARELLWNLLRLKHTA